MSDASVHAAPPAGSPPHVPSVFISYAAEDRMAARGLRDTLGAAGLDVWYDEEELAGGDAWDRKIRLQIRDCDYFMPVISANTEARKEGYFRREWRLATERTLDMADDVLFLLPVGIDETPEMGARVPEKFLTVQWLRAPGGHPTPALAALLERLRAGEQHALPRRASGTTRAPFAYHRSTVTTPLSGPAPADPGATPPPLLPPPMAPAGGDRYTLPPPPKMPPFPPVPEKGGFFHGVKFLAEVLWWALTAAWMLFARLPRWARVLLTVWIVLTLFSMRCSRPDTSPSRPTPGRSAENLKKMRQVADRISQDAREAGVTIDASDLSKFASEIAQVFKDGVSDAPAAGKTLVVVPFSLLSDTTPEGKFAQAVFLAFYGRVSLNRHGDTGVVPPRRQGAEPSAEALLARAKALNAGFMLAASVGGEGAEAALRVRLFSVATSELSWGKSYPIRDANPTEVAELIANEVIERVPRQELRRGK